MSTRETELIAPIDMRPVADSFLQAALGGQVAVGQSQYYLELDTTIPVDHEASAVAVTDEPKTTAPEPVAVEKGPQRSNYELQLIKEHAAAMALATTVEEPRVSEEPASSYTFGPSASAYSPAELNARISQARRARKPGANVVDYGQDRLFMKFYGRSAGLGRR